MKKYSIAVFLVSSLFMGGCFSRSYYRKSIDEVFPEKGSSSFLALIFSDTSINRHYVERRDLVRIDSLGEVYNIGRVDSGLYYCRIINDSLVMSTSFEDSIIYLYNVISARKQKLVRGRLSFLSSDRKLVFVESWDYKDPAIEAYSLENGKKISSIQERLTPFGNNRYIKWIRRPKSGDADIEILDSALTSIQVIKSERPHYFDFQSMMPGVNKNEVIFLSTPMALNHFQNVALTYNLDTKQVDTLFAGLYYSRILPLADSNYFLVLGMTNNEYDELMDRQYKEWKEARKDGVYIDYGPPTGYWMIADKRTNQYKKTAFGDMRPILSSNGKYILFYDNVSRGYKAITASIQSLLVP